MKSTFSLCLLVFCMHACVSKPEIDIYDPGNYARITSEQDSIKEMQVILFLKTDSRRSMTRTYYDDGSLMGIGYFHDNKKDGRWVQYFDSKVSFEGTFLDGRKNGIHKYYFPDGRPSLIEEYKNGKITSKKEYDKSGQIILDEKYNIKE